MFVYSLEEGKKRNKKELSKLKHEITCLPNLQPSQISQAGSREKRTNERTKSLVG